MKRIRLLSLSVILVIGLLIVGCSKSDPSTPKEDVAAKEPVKIIELKYNDWGPEAIMLGQVGKEAAKMVEEKTNGRVKVTPYFSETLLKYGDTFTGTATGVADISLYVSSFSKGIHALNLIFNRQFAEEAPGYGKLGDVYREMLVNVPELQQEMEKTGVRWLSIESLPGNMINTTKKPVKVPADMKGMKIASSGDGAAMVNAVGGAAVSLPPNDWYMSLERGLVDGILLHWAAIDAFKVVERVKYHTQFGPGGTEASAFGFVVNAKTWNSLPPDIQKVLTEVYTWANQKMKEENIKKFDQIIADSKARGNTFIELTQDERAKWSPYMQTINDKWVADTEAKGLPAKKAYEELTKLFKKYK